MKPRLRAAPLTDEDRAAWFDWQVNRNRDLRLWGALERSFDSDRRDADLMHWAQSQRWIQIEDGVSHYGGPLRLFDKDLGGEAQR